MTKSDHKMTKRVTLHVLGFRFFINRCWLVGGTLPEPESVKAGADFEGSHTDLYDRVLVDAECTHDGSIKHLTKYDK
jgi:hypothetical protein